MLHLDSNQYQIVDMNSGIRVLLCQPGETTAGREQVWQVNAHFVPDEYYYQPRSDGRLEYLEFSLHTEFFQTKDWCRLASLGLKAEDGDVLALASVQNLLSGEPPRESRTVSIDDFMLEQKEEHLFEIHLEGECKMPDGQTVRVTMGEYLHFKEAVAQVPLNAANPVKAAQTMASNMISLTKFAGSRVQPYDPQRQTSLRSHINSHHQVTLQTPWQL